MSLNYVIAEPISRYLKPNINNYIEILNSCIEWHSTHDYQFVTKNKDTIKYNKFTNDLIAIRDNYLNNKSTFKKEWTEESDEFMKNSDSMLHDIERKIMEIDKELKKLK